MKAGNQYVTSASRIFKDAKIIAHPFHTVKMFVVQVLEDEAVVHVYAFWNIAFLRIPPKIYVKSCKASKNSWTEQNQQ